MLHAVHYPRDLIADRVRFTPADQAQIAQCRGAHNRLGFAYQLGFLRLTGRFPAQQPWNCSTTSWSLSPMRSPSIPR